MVGTRWRLFRLLGIPISLDASRPTIPFVGARSPDQSFHRKSSPQRGRPFPSAVVARRRTVIKTIVLWDLFTRK